MVVVRRPAFPIIANVSVMMVMSAIGTLPNVAMRWILTIFAQRSSMGSSRLHGSDKGAWFFSSSPGVSVPYSARRWVSMARSVTSLNPKSGSLKALRNDALTAVRI